MCHSCTPRRDGELVCQNIILIFPRPGMWKRTFLPTNKYLILNLFGQSQSLIGFLHMWNLYCSLCTDTNWQGQTAKNQVRLRKCAVWPGSSCSHRARGWFSQNTSNIFHSTKQLNAQLPSPYRSIIGPFYKYLKTRCCCLYFDNLIE